MHFIGTSLFVTNYNHGGHCATTPSIVRFDSQAAEVPVISATFTDQDAIDLMSVGTTLVVSSTLGSVTTFSNATTGTGARPAGTVHTALGQSGVTGSYDLQPNTYGMATIAPDGNHTLVADSGGNRVLQVDLSLPVTPPASPSVHVTTGGSPLVQSGSTDPIANITLTELSPGALPMGTNVCIASAGHPFRAATATAPTVTATGGNGTAGAPTSASGRMSVPITKTSTTATTYTVSGITLDPASTPGPVVVTVGTACGQAEPDLATGLQAGFLGSEKRLSGSTRYASAQIIADSVEPLQSPAQPADCKGTVILANGVNYPDALAASTIAGTTTPILLVNDAIPAETASAIKQHGVTHVIIVGGPSSVSNAIQSQLEGQLASACGGATNLTTKITTERVFGPDRYATAKAVAELHGAAGAGTAPTASSPTCTPVKSAIVVSGETFADALAAGVLAGGGATCHGVNGGPLPLLLTSGGNLSASALQAMNDLGIKQVLLVGGASTVSDTVLGQIQNVGGTNNIVVKRIAGATRQDTAATLAAVMGTPEFGFYGFQPDLDRYSGELLLTRGDTFRMLWSARPRRPRPGAAPPGRQPDLARDDGGQRDPGVPTGGHPPRSAGRAGLALAGRLQRRRHGDGQQHQGPVAVTWGGRPPDVVSSMGPDT